MIVLLKAAVAGLLASVIAGGVALAWSLLSISRTMRRLGLDREMENWGFFVIEPAFFVLVSSAFVVGFIAALWWLRRP